MKFDSKAHMAQELLAGKRFRDNAGLEIHYDEKYPIPFRYSTEAMSGRWNSYNRDIWTEVNSRHVHQDLIDSYQKGQAWQFSKGNGFKNVVDSDDNWTEPSWIKHYTYRLHPHNDLIQKHHNGATIEYFTSNGWAETTHPTWNEDTQYRIKPATKIVYEWVFKSKYANNWKIENLLFSEEEAKEHFKEHAYCKTGREFEVEA